MADGASMVRQGQGIRGPRGLQAPARRGVGGQPYVLVLESIGALGESPHRGDVLDVVKHAYRAAAVVRDGGRSATPPHGRAR